MKVKRWGVFMLAATLFIGTAGKAVEVKAENETDTSYLNARVSSKGSAEGDAVIKGDCAGVAVLAAAVAAGLVLRKKKK